MATLHVSFHINFWSTLTIQLGHHNKMPAWRLQDTTESFTDSCGACASIWSRTPRHGIAVLISFHPKSKASWTWWFTGDRRWRLHLSLSGNAVPIVWLPESATRSSGHPFQNRSYCRVVLGSFPIRPPADFGLAFASNLFDWKCYNCGDVAWALRSLGAAIATVCVCVCLAGPWAVCAVPALLVLKSVGVENLESLWALLWSRNHAGSRPKVGSPQTLWPMCCMCGFRPDLLLGLRIWCQLLHLWETNTTIGTTQTPPTARTTEHHRDFTEARPWPKGGRPSDERRCPRERLNESSGRRFFGGTRILGNDIGERYWGSLNRERTNE